MSDEDNDFSAINDDYKFDFGRVGALLSIVQAVASTAPGFVYISAEAMAELREINDELKEIQQERADIRAKEMAEERQKELERQREAANEDNNPPEPSDNTLTGDMAAAQVPGQPQPNVPAYPSQPAEHVGRPTPPVNQPPRDDRNRDGKSDAQQRAEGDRRTPPERRI